MDLIKKYTDFARSLNELVSIENEIHNKRRLMQSFKKELIDEGDGGFGIEFSGHSFKQISERLEEIAMESPIVYNDVYNREPTEILLLPSNLKSFVITMLANAREKDSFKEEKSKSPLATSAFPVKIAL